MKKIYTLLAVAGASALACSAAQPMQKGTTPFMDLKPAVLENVALGSFQNVDKAEIKNGIHRAPATVAAPANLENEIIEVNYLIGTEGDMTEATNVLTFKLTESDQDGNQLYSVSGWFDGLFSDVVTVHPLSALYTPADGVLRFLTSESVMTAPDDNKVPQDYNIWAHCTDGYFWNNVPVVFEYANGYFEWVNPIYGSTEEEENHEFNVDAFYIARAVGQQLSYIVMFSDMNMRVADGRFESIIEYFNPNNPSAGQQDIESVSAVYTTIESNLLTMANFGGIGEDVAVPFVVNAADKTLTTTNTILETFDGNPVYLAEENSNQFPVKDGDNYLLKGSYVAEGNATIITFPRWNGFTIVQGEPDYPVFYSRRTSTVTLNFNLDSMIAGVGNIVVDDANAPVEYYNLQGVRVQNPENGLYIRRQGNKATKVVL